MILGVPTFIMDKPRGALPLTKCCFFRSLLWVRRILGDDGGGGLKKGENTLRAME
jgi:hypothetical protein